MSRPPIREPRKTVLCHVCDGTVMDDARQPFGLRFAAPALRSLWRTNDTGISRTKQL
jgi:hypothetical protein